MQINSRPFIPHAIGLGMLALTLLACASPAGAQTPTTLSLSSPVSVAQQGQQVTFTVLLDGGSDIGGYDFSVYLNSPLLSFAPSGFTFNPAAGFTAGAPFTFSAITGNQLEASSAINAGTPGLGPQAGTALGTFTVLVNNAPTALDLTQITFGAIGDPFNGDSQVENSEGTQNILTATTPASLTLLPAPEPSGLITYVLGAAGVGCALSRRRKQASRKENVKSQ